jgi:hypothetical protein
MHHLAHILFITLACIACVRGEDQVYTTPSAFIRKNFEEEMPEISVLKLSNDAKTRAKKIMGHEFAETRVRHWSKEGRNVWILEEIGKEKLITTGFVIEKGAIKSTEILIYRESHGWEVSKPFFTQQFKNATLKEGDKLSNEIKNIAGATLSVRAVTKLSRLALYFDSLL